MLAKSRKKAGVFYHPDMGIEKGLQLVLKVEEQEIVKTQVVSIKKQESVDDTGFGVAEPAVNKNKFDTKTLKGEEPKKPVDDSTKNVAVSAIKDDSSSGEKIDRSNYTGPQPPIPPRDCGCKLLFMSNLHSSIEESDVRNFFKDDGKVVSVEFSIKGTGHVEFETYDASRKALKRNGEMLLGYPIKLLYSEDRTIWDLITPNPKYKYLFMGNLNPSIEKNDVVEFFKADGTVKLVRLMTHDPDSVGYGHVEFASFDEALKAVQRDGQMLRGRKVELVLASESSVWHEYTPSSRKPPRLGIRRGPRYGPTRRGDGPLRYS